MNSILRHVAATQKAVRLPVCPNCHPLFPDAVHHRAGFGNALQGDSLEVGQEIRWRRQVVSPSQCCTVARDEDSLHQRWGTHLLACFGRYDAFKLAITESEDIWDHITLDESLKAALIDQVKRRLTPQAVKIRSDIEVACYAYEGINAVKEALRAGLALSTEDLEIKVRAAAGLLDLPDLFRVPCLETALIKRA